MIQKGALDEAFALISMSARCAPVVCQASGMPEPLIIRMDDLRAALSRALVAA